MAEPKNPFDFGTGSIDKDQWLRDIDAEQDAFISRYSGAVNKHRATLLRDAFTDLRRRIANGDMLNRTADGLYQFGSALNREDKHMQEAYQRALGFMGGLARRQIQTPPAAEPEKKTYSPKMLNDRFIRYFNPNGSQTAFASLWNSYDDTLRIEGLKSFLGEELKNLDNYLDVSDYDSKDILISRINEFLKTPNLTNLNKLGFDKNYLGLLVSEELEAAPKTEEEQVALELDNYKQLQALALNKLLLEALNNSIEGTLQFNWNPGQDFLSGLNNYFLKELGWTTKNPYIRSGVYFEQDEKDKDGKITFSNRPYYTQKTLGEKDQLYDYILNQYANNYKTKYLGDLNSYFKDFGTRYTSLYENDRNNLINNLNKLFALYNGQGVTNWEKYFTKTDKGYIINGSLDKYGNYAILTQNGIELHNSNKDALAYKLGGILKGADGFVFDASKYHSSLDASANLSSKATLQPEATNLQESNEEMDLGKIANIATPLVLDIASMISANGVGIGSLVSAGTGVASTIWLGVNDWDSNNILGSLGSIGANLLADGVGIVPGLGIAGKVGKIAKGLAKNAKYFGYAFNAIGATDASLVLYKGVKNGFDLSPDEWKTLAYGLAGVAQGAAGVKRANRTNLKRGAATQQVYNSTNKKGETYPVVVGIEDATPGKTGKRRYIANKNDILEVREKTLTPDWSDSMDRSFVKIMHQPRSSVILHSWESLNNPFRNPFSLEKSRNKFNSFAELWRKRKGKPSNTTKTSTETPSEKYGGVLKALRKGGIIKGEHGIAGILYVDGSSWYNNVFTHYKLDILNTLKNDLSSDRLYANWLNRMLDKHSDIYKLAGGESLSWIGNAFKGEDVRSYLDMYGGANNWNQDFNALGIGKGNDPASMKGLPIRYAYEGKRLNLDNSLKGWTPDGLYSAITNDRTILGRVSDWEGHGEELELFKNDLKTLGYTLDPGEDSYLRLHPIVASTPENPPAVTPEEEKKKGDKVVGDEETELGSIFETKFKNPMDPTPWFIAGKTALGLIGNRNIYKNLLDEMPQAPLRDPINRQLAIVGWQEQIKQGQNQLADLKHATWMQHGSDQQTNLAGMHEVENKGRGIMDDKYMKDSERLFDTALKLWNLKNEDVLYNTKVGDDNRKAIADKARMMAQIRAAWRSGDNNILMGALSDTGNWMMKKYQREQDLISLAREQLLGTKELFIENLLLQNPNYEALKTEYETTKDANRKAQIASEILKMKMEVLRKAPSDWAQKIYTTFHTPGFGGGFSESLLKKDGGKMEIAKLKARGKDNDRYVSMIKDLRKSSYRRRRR